MEEKAGEMAWDMRILTRCTKAETKNMKSEAYECLVRDREKVNMNAISEKCKPYSPRGQ